MCASMQGVPLIATSPVRHELPQNMQPTPVEVHKYNAPWHVDNSPDMDDPPPSPSETLHALGGLLTAEHRSLVDAHALSALSASCESFVDSFDDDTVVSFDDLSEVASVQPRYVAANSPPTIVDSHAHHHAHSVAAAAQVSALDASF